MQETIVGLIAAMPEEIKPLLRRAGTVRRERLNGLPCYHFSLAGHRCCLVESGMGPKRAVVATRALLAAAPPRYLLNFGFAGAVRTGPVVGDIVVAKRLLCLHERLCTEEAGLDPKLVERLLSSLSATDDNRTLTTLEGSFITASGIVAKAELARILPSDLPHPVLEMETAAVARVAVKAEIPLVALRAISDAAGEELGFAITDFTDADLNLRLHRILLTVAKRPWIVPQLFRLAKNARRAGEALAAAVETAVANL
jgi:adenosylhomocysteine nucleosidase